MIIYPEIGDILDVEAIAEPVYDEFGNRTIIGFPLVVNMRAWYVGYTFKQEGKYYKGTSYPYYYSSEFIEHQNPYLEIKNTYKVYRIRFHERGKEHYCFPEDAKIIKGVRE